MIDSWMVFLKQNGSGGGDGGGGGGNGGSSGPAWACSVQGGDFIPDRVNCSRFWVCARDRTVHLRSCNNNMFDYQIRQCVLPGRGRCWATEHGIRFNATVVEDTNRLSVELFDVVTTEQVVDLQ